MNVNFVFKKKVDLDAVVKWKDTKLEKGQETVHPKAGSSDTHVALTMLLFPTATIFKNLYHITDIQICFLYSGFFHLQSWSVCVDHIGAT